MTNKYDTTLLTRMIEKLCLEKNIPVKEMLVQSGLSRNVVDNLKKGSVPSVDKIAQIADYFGCSVDYILGRTNEPKINSINIIKTGNITGDNINGSNNINIHQSSASAYDAELMELIKALPLIKRAEAVLYLNELKNKN